MFKSCMAVRCWEAWNAWGGDGGKELSVFAQGCDRERKAKSVGYRNWLIVFSDGSSLQVWYDHGRQHEITVPVPSGRGMAISPDRQAIDSVVEDIWLGPQAGYVEEL
jgi:hypothetical protein